MSCCLVVDPWGICFGAKPTSAVSFYRKRHNGIVKYHKTYMFPAGLAKLIQSVAHCRKLLL